MQLGTWFLSRQTAERGAHTMRRLTGRQKRESTCSFISCSAAGLSDALAAAGARFAADASHRRAAPDTPRAQRLAAGVACVQRLEDLQAELAHQAASKHLHSRGRRRARSKEVNARPTAPEAHHPQVAASATLAWVDASPLHLAITPGDRSAASGWHAGWTLPGRRRGRAR